MLKCHIISLRKVTQYFGCHGDLTKHRLCAITSFAVFGTDPDMTREGGSIPVTLTLQEATGKNVMLLPLGACDDGAHSQNEKMDRKNYIEGVSIAGNEDNLSYLSLSVMGQFSIWCRM